MFFESTSMPWYCYDIKPTSGFLFWSSSPETASFCFRLKFTTLLETSCYYGTALSIRAEKRCVTSRTAAVAIYLDNVHGCHANIHSTWPADPPQNGWWVVWSLSQKLRWLWSMWFLPALVGLMGWAMYEGGRGTALGRDPFLMLYLLL